MKRRTNGNQENNGDFGLYMQKELILYPAIKPYLPSIMAKAEKMQLIYEDLDDKLLIAGYQEDVLDFISWMYELMAETMERAVNESTAMMFGERNNDFKKEDISISAFHRVKQSEILKQTEKLRLTCDFGYDVVRVSGTPENVREFKSYLHELETEAKRSLYPRYWDFHTIAMYSEIDVEHSSEEFQAVEKLIKYTMPKADILNVKRIQNKYLMDHYVSMLEKRQELRTNKVINRKALFYGSKIVNPEEIYQSFDTGFDLQFASENGTHGKGLYFSSEALYSHRAGQLSDLGNRMFQLILADVFIGNAYKSGPDTSLKKAPRGYDSVESSTYPFYVIYNNFHSYPLYLIDYRIDKGNTVMVYQDHVESDFLISRKTKDTGILQDNMKKQVTTSKLDKPESPLLQHHNPQLQQQSQLSVPAQSLPQTTENKKKSSGGLFGYLFRDTVMFRDFHTF